MKSKPAVLALAVALSVASAHGQLIGWWDSDWAFRRIVTVNDSPTKLPGEDVAVVQFPTHGALAAGGRDVRVLANRREVPHLVVQVGPGDLCRVAFAVAKGTRQVAIYYGNPKAPEPKGEWQPRRGLLLETRKWPGGPLSRLDRVRATMRVRATEIQGRDFVPEIFWGINRFAPTGNECNYYLGWLICKQAGEYEFSTTSDDASFLAINGKQVVAWPGRHRARRDAKFIGKVRLTPGLQRIEYYHVNIGVYGMAVAAWKPPEQRRISKIPAKAFAPVFRATLGKLDQQRKRRTADFVWAHDGEAFFRNLYVQRMHFRASVPSAIRPAAVRWDFGDGITAQGPEVRHVFLSNGPRRVTMQFDWMGSTHKITNTVHVDRDWARQADRRLIGLKRIFSDVAEYDWARMTGADLKVAVELFGKLAKTDELLNVCSAVVASPKSSERIRAEAALLAAEQYVEKREEPDAAIAMLADVTKRTTEPTLRARLMIRHGRVLLDAVGDRLATDAAEKLYASVLKMQGLDAPLRRHALIGSGDVWRRRADGEKARENYQKADEIRIFKRNHTQNVVRIGALARYVEEYVRTGTWKDARRFLKEWEWEYPLERLRGYSTLLRVKMAEKRDLPDKAAALATETVRANPKSPYADQLLLRAADDYHKADADDLAREAIQMILKDYPESPLVGKARARLKQWSQPD